MALAAERMAALGEWLSMAEAIALGYFRDTSLAVENKDRHGFDPVTAADRAIEQSFIDFIQGHFPGDAVIGEEFPSTVGKSGFAWTIDPIDGTRAFFIGAPLFTILVALDYQDRSIGGVISQPFTQERFIAQPEGGAHFIRHRQVTTAIKTAATLTLDRAIMATTFPEIGSPAERAAFDALAGRVRMVRYGMDAYAFALLAMGHIDLVVEAGLKPFDYKAPMAVIRAAGGHFSNWQGQAPEATSTIIAAANPRLAVQAMALLNGQT